MSRPAPVEQSPAPEKGYVTIRLDWFRVVFAAILAFTVVTRFYGLSLKPFHHDESLYATYSWYLFEGRGYKYDPMMHGPFMFYLDALLFTLFGVGDFVARMGAALFGVGLVWCAWLFRKELGKAGALSTAALFAVSPTFMYFSRFFREDVFVAFWALLSVGLFVNRLRAGSRGWLYGASAAFSLMFCVKENSYMFLAIFVSFWAFMLLFERCFGRAALPGTPCAAGGGRRLLGLLDTVVALGIFFAIFYLFFTSFFRNPPGFIDGLYRKSLGYWMHQDKIQRIKGPFTYFCPIAATYELPLLAVLFAGVVATLRRHRLSLAVMAGSSAVALPLMCLWNRPLPVAWDTLFHMTSTLHVVFALYVFALGMAATCTCLREGRRFAAFVSYWSWTSLLLYSYAGEKVPWLLMHVLMPMVLWAGVLLGDFFASERFRRNTNAYAALLGVGLLLFLQASLRLCFVNEANPVECMVYTQTSTDIQKTLRIINALAEETGKGLQLPIGIQGESTWPYTWYLRDYKDWFHPGTFTAPSKMVVAVDWDKRRDFSAVLEPHYRETRMKLREWWVPSPLGSLKSPGPGWAERVFGRRPFSVFIADSSHRLRALLRYYFSRQVWSVLGSQDIAFYVRRDLLGEAPGPVSAAEAPQAPAVAKEYAVIGTTSPDAVFGERGSAAGRFDEPRGIWADATGAIYVADTKNHRWQKLDAQGKPLLTVGKPGSGPAEFKEPMGIAVDGDGFVYVADTWNHRIQKFDREGRFVKEWGGGAGGFWAPKGMAFDREGNLYVVDTGRHRVQKFTSGGSYLLHWGDQGEGPGEFREPVGIVVVSGEAAAAAGDDTKQTPGDAVLVADTANKRVQRFDTKGRFLGQFRVLGWEEYYTEPFAAADSAGRIWLTDSRNNRIQIFSPDGVLQALWSAKGFKPGDFNVPTGIFIADGRVYVSDTHNHRVQVFAEKRVCRR
ncbi:MAG TPA: TIGR03663 family protein [bacterium]|nr:TIGR03663 family protein [bacterium]